MQQSSIAGVTGASSSTPKDEANKGRSGPAVSNNMDVIMGKVKALEQQSNKMASKTEAAMERLAKAQKDFEKADGEMQQFKAYYDQVMKELDNCRQQRDDLEKVVMKTSSDMNSLVRMTKDGMRSFSSQAKVVSDNSAIAELNAQRGYSCARKLGSA